MTPYWRLESVSVTWRVAGRGYRNVARAAGQDDVGESRPRKLVFAGLVDHPNQAEALGVPIRESLV